MVAMTYDESSRAEYESHVAMSDDRTCQVNLPGDVTANWYYDCRRTSDRKLSRLLIFNTQADKKRVLEMYPGPTAGVIAEHFPEQDIRRSLALYLPKFEFGPRFPNYQRIALYIMRLKYELDAEVLECLRMQQRLSKAYLECMTEGAAGMDTYYQLQQWTENIRLIRARYHPEALKDPRHRQGGVAPNDVGIDEDGMVVDLLTDDWKISWRLSGDGRRPRMLDALEALGEYQS